MYSDDIAHIDPDISFKTPSYPYPFQGLLFLVLSHSVLFWPISFAELEYFCAEMPNLHI